jgi:antitoxin VapB
MALFIKNPEVDRLARELARRRGETITAAILAALRSEIEREKSRMRPPDRVEELMQIARRCAALPVLDTRSDDEIFGYDENGLPR